MPGGGNLVRSPRYKKTPRTPRSAHARYYYTRSLVLDAPRRPNTPTRCQSAPRVMDNHSRSASPRDAPRPQHRPPSPPSPPAAFENRAYQHDESDPNHNDSFTSNAPHQKGHSKEPNGETKIPEAVNLELINLTPKNGSTKKKDVEVDMNATNPYDEYFVPVNEHRKYMRGEKLYVTADKRGEKGGCKRPLCWTLLALVVAAIVALIVLAATGVLFSNSPTPLEQYNTSSVSSARALGGLGAVHRLDHTHDHDHEQDHHAEHKHQEKGTQNDEEYNNPADSEESGDSSMYVPRTLEGELKIDNEDFTAALKDPESDEYREFSTNFANALKRALFNRNTIENGDSDITVEVVKVRKGSVIVTYRVHWRPKSSMEHTEDLLTPTSLKMNMDKYLAKNSRMISVYHIAEDKMSTRNVLDLCQINKNDCDHGCVFDETTLDFICVCPRGQILDIDNPKKCMYILESPDQAEHKPTEDPKQKEFRVLDLGSVESPTKTTTSEVEEPTTEPVHSAEHDHLFDWKDAHHVTQETTTESDPDLKFSHIFGHPNNKHIEYMTTTPNPETSPEPEPQPTTKTLSEAEPKPEPEPTSEPEHSDEVEPQPEPEPTSEPEPAVDSKPEPEPTSEPQPISEPTPKTTPSSTLIVEPLTEPTPSPEPEPSSEPETSSKSEPTSEPEPISEPEPTSEPEPASESETTSEPQSIHKHMQESEPSAEPQPIPKTKLKPTAEPVPQSEPTPTSQPAPATQVSTMTSTTGKETEHKTHLETKPTVYINELKHDTQTSDEMESPIETTTTKSTRVSISEPNVINNLNYESKPEVISIFNENKQTKAPLLKLTISENKETTTENQEVEPNVHKNIQERNSEMEVKNEPDISTQSSVYMMNGISKDEKQTEEKSLKTDTKLEDEPTTIKMKLESDDDFLFGFLNTDENTESENKTNTDDSTVMTTMAVLPINTPNLNRETVERNNTTNDTNSNTERETTKITSLIDEARLLGTNIKIETTTATEPAIVTETEYSISKQYNQLENDKSLLEALENTKGSQPNQTTTEKSVVDEGTEITFDAINMLFNRSSKSIDNKNPLELTEKNELENATEVTTESDWLSAAVTEINYDDIINKMNKHPTTESTMNKFEEIMNRGLAKDDFEPDYLNMGTNKPIETDEPMYGMIHDYDNEDSRVKRVNKDAKSMNSAKATTVMVPELNSKEVKSNENVKMASKINEPVYSSIENVNSQKNTEKRANKEKEFKQEKISKDSAIVVPTVPDVPMETTTVTQYVYKVAAQNESVKFSYKDTNNPAPVWEHSDLGRDFVAKELPISVNKNASISNIFTVKEKVLSNATTEMLPSIAATLINNENETLRNVGNDQDQTQNMTHISNLNVTIYEKPSHNNSHSFNPSKPSTSHSTEYDDHEKETNPFLPEVENNNSLVKKLQEGHDLEPTNLNETQNENLEEHNTHSSDVHMAAMSNESSNNEERRLTGAVEDDSMFNELLMNESSNSREQEAEANRHETNNTFDELNNKDKLKSEEKVTLSTFLIDTDDLDVSKEHSSTMAENKLENDAISTTLVPEYETAGSKFVTEDDSEYLSVVPIAEERLGEREMIKRNYKTENIHELNDISDSRKKSDRRTFDATKLDSVINNEA